MKPPRLGRLPLLPSLLLLLPALAGTAGAETLRVPAQGPWPDDPVLLAADYVPPRTAGAPVLILLHGLGSHRREWASLVRAAEARGWGALAYDARGHGESQRTRQGRTVSWKDFQEDPVFWRGMVDDLLRVTEALRAQKGIAPERTALVGASLGANVALNAAAQRPEARAVALLSPGLGYAGIQTEPAIRQWKGPVLFVAAEPDAYAFESARRLERAAGPERGKSFLLRKGGPRGAHGTQLFDGGLEERILDWIGGEFPAERQKRPPPK